MTTVDERYARQILDEVMRRAVTSAPGDGQELDEPTRRSWRPVDLADVLAGRYRPPMPTVGARDDGVGLFYPGRMHSVAAESEAGETWLMPAAAASEMAAGNAVAYLDFEDDEGGIVGRLLAMGTPADHIRDRFIYIRPEGSIKALGARDDLLQALGDARPTLVTLDGVTEGMVMHGLDPLSNADVAEFGRILLRPIADTGAAVVTLDHVTKDRDGRGRYALGAVHKLNGLNGAAYALENREPFGVGVTGRSGLYITKDRPGQLRRHAVNSAGGTKWFADLVGTSHADDFIEISIAPPLPDQPGPGAPRSSWARSARSWPTTPKGCPRTPSKPWPTARPPSSGPPSNSSSTTAMSAGRSGDRPWFTPSSSPTGTSHDPPSRPLVPHLVPLVPDEDETCPHAPRQPRPTAARRTVRHRDTPITRTETRRHGRTDPR